MNARKNVNFGKTNFYIKTAIFYSGPISSVPKNEQLGEKRTCKKLQINISKTEKRVRVYTDGQRTDSL